MGDRRKIEEVAREGRGRRIALLLSLLPISLPGVGFPASPPTPVRAHPVPSVPRSDTLPDTRADPTEVADRAVEAQRRFERLRRRHAPPAWPRYERCDEVVGRFCLWHEDEDWEPPPEDPEVAVGRGELLAELQAAATELRPGPEPRIGDLSAREWVQGQRVRYLAEAGRLAEARKAVRECGCRRWWRRALAGFVHHVSGEYRRAGEAFAAALAGLSREERCRWEDLSLLLDGEGRDGYTDLSCSERAGVEARFWWLADPLWSVPGDERRTEHYWRHVMDRLQEEAGSGYGISWGADLRELLIRYGWPAGWDRVRARPGSLSGGGTAYLARDPPGARRYAPRGEWLEDTVRIEPGAAEEEVHAPRSRYAPALIPELVPLRHQLARFRRGEEMVVVAGWERPPPDAGPGSCPGARAGLVVAGGPQGPPAVALDGGEGSRGALTVTVHPGRSSPVASVEWLCPGRLAARSRYTLDPLPAQEGGSALSDLLVLEGGATPPDDLEAAARRARGSLGVRPGESVGLYWEVYGIREGSEAEVSLVLVREGGGFFRRVGELLGLAGEREPSAELRWWDGAAGSVVSRSALLGIPDLDEGRYRLELRVTPRGGVPLTAVRLLRVEGP